MRRMMGFLLAASLCSAGYSSWKSAWPIVLFTCAIEWHIMQPRPACAGGGSLISRMGRSNMPLYRSAGSWQPAHHLEGFTPTTSCMYSMLLRYQALLNEEKWCAELCHCLEISEWQRSQLCDSIK